jgi:hypothetical protein
MELQLLLSICSCSSSIQNADGGRCCCDRNSCSILLQLPLTSSTLGRWLLFCLCKRSKAGRDGVGSDGDDVNSSVFKYIFLWPRQHQQIIVANRRRSVNAFCSSSFLLWISSAFWWVSVTFLRLHVWGEELVEFINDLICSLLLYSRSTQHSKQL